MPNVPAPSSSGSSPTARKPIDPTVSGVFYALGAFLMWGVLSLLFRALQPATPLEGTMAKCGRSWVVCAAAGG